MMKLIVSTLVIVGLLFGGNATVSAAQNDLPNQPLYQIKLMSEDAHLWFTSDPVQQVEMLMQQAQTRLQEMEALTAQGVTPPAALTLRAQEKIQRALQLAMGLDDPSKVAILQQLRTRLQTQEQLMQQLQQSNCTECEPVLQQTRDMLRLQLREVEGDLVTPAPAPLQLQNQNQNQNQNQYQNQVRTTQTPQAIGTTTPSCGTCTPALDGTGQQNGNISAATPMQQQNQNGDGNQNGTGSGGGSQNGPGSDGGNQNGSGSGGNGPSSGSGGSGQGGKP